MRSYRQDREVDRMEECRDGQIGCRGEHQNEVKVERCYLWVGRCEPESAGAE